jgi:Tfp pilus assembly protein PilO
MIVFKEKQKQIAIYIIAVALIGCFIFLRYLPLRKKVSNLEQLKDTQIMAIIKSQEQYQQLPQLQAQLLKLQQEISHYDLQIPPRRQLGEFLQRGMELMSQYNLKEQVIQPGEEIKIEKLNCIPITMQCKGKLSQIFEFYKSLQQIDRLVRIEQVKLTRTDNSGDEVIMDARAVIYYRSQPEQG